MQFICDRSQTSGEFARHLVDAPRRLGSGLATCRPGQVRNLDGVSAEHGVRAASRGKRIRVLQRMGILPLAVRVASPFQPSLMDMFYPGIRWLLLLRGPAAQGWGGGDGGGEGVWGVVGVWGGGVWGGDEVRGEGGGWWGGLCGWGGGVGGGGVWVWVGGFVGFGGGGGGGGGWGGFLRVFFWVLNVVFSVWCFLCFWGFGVFFVFEGGFWLFEGGVVYYLSCLRVFEPVAAALASLRFRSTSLPIMAPLCPTCGHGRSGDLESYLLADNSFTAPCWRPRNGCSARSPTWSPRCSRPHPHGMIRAANPRRSHCTTRFGGRAIRLHDG